MKSVLKIIAIAAALISVAATVILAYLYLEDASKHLKNARKKLAGWIGDRITGQKQLEEICEFE